MANGNGQEKLLKQLFRESWLTLVLLLGSALFTSGATYTKVVGDINVNTVAIATVQQQITQTRSDIEQQRTVDRQELNDRLDKIDAKLDEINRYLRNYSLRVK